MENKFVKGLTLVGFMTLIIGFVAYQSGYLEQVKKPTSETSFERGTSVRPDPIEYLNSSNTLGFEEIDGSLAETKKIIQSNDSTHLHSDSTIEFLEKVLMYSSKSAVVLSPEDINLESIKKTTDTQKVHIDTFYMDESSEFMFSSKSGKVFEAKDIEIESKVHSKDSAISYSDSILNHRIYMMASSKSVSVLKPTDIKIDLQQFNKQDSPVSLSDSISLHQTQMISSSKYIVVLEPEDIKFEFQRNNKRDSSQRK